MCRALFGLLTLLVCGWMTPAAGSAEIYGATGFHMDWWHNQGGVKGLQYHIPIEAGGALGAFSYKLLTAYAFNDIELADGSSLDFDGLVDTRVNLAYSLIDRLPLDLLFALDLNLPTGKTKLSRDDFASILDPDKVTLTRLGEGFNINPSLILLKQFGGLLASLGAGYIWRGEYDPTETVTDYDPGDALNLTAELGYNFNPQWLARLFGSYTHFEKDQRAGQDYFQAGAVTNLGGSLAYLRAQWEISASAQIVLRDKDKDTVLPGMLVTDTTRYYGDEWIFQLKGRYQLTDRVSLGAVVQYLTISANDYPDYDWHYLSRRDKLLGGIELLFRPVAHWEAGLKVQAYQMNVQDNPWNTYVNEDFEGGAAAFWITARY